MSCYLRPHRAQVTTCRIQSQEVRYTMTLVVANTRPQAIAVSCLGLLGSSKRFYRKAKRDPWEHQKPIVIPAGGYRSRWPPRVQALAETQVAAAGQLSSPTSVEQETRSGEDGSTAKQEVRRALPRKVAEPLDPISVDMLRLAQDSDLSKYYDDLA